VKKRVLVPTFYPQSLGLDLLYRKGRISCLRWPLGTAQVGAAAGVQPASIRGVGECGRLLALVLLETVARAPLMGTPFSP
jgi:hypothetical protein